MLSLTEHVQQHTIVFDLTGGFDGESTKNLECHILEARRAGCQRVILNFSEITGIDSVGLGQLFLLYHRLKPHHLHLSIVSPCPEVQRALESVHMQDILPIFTSEAEAVRPNVCL